MKHPMSVLSLFILAVVSLPFPAMAGDVVLKTQEGLPITSAPLALACVAIFIVSYLIVLTEEFSHMRKSKPVMLGAGLIWMCVAVLAKRYEVDHEELHHAVLSGLEEYSSLLLFLL